MQPTPDIEPILPFIRRAGVVAVGRHKLRRTRKKLEFVWIATDLSENSRHDVLKWFPGLPIIEYGTTEDFARWFGFTHTKLVGLRRSSVAHSALERLRRFRVTPPE
ncbi:MAG: hypothetical protein GXP31_00765 [Kiritimatiellaeota bacterium]|nr:hypothetical protein [Kiritimatiellota bacterium]